MRGGFLMWVLMKLRRWVWFEVWERVRVGEGVDGFCGGFGRVGFGIGESCGSDGGFCSSKGMDFGLRNLLITTGDLQQWP